MLINMAFKFKNLEKFWIILDQGIIVEMSTKCTVRYNLLKYNPWL